MTPRTRLSPEQRREQLLELGVRWLSDRPFADLSVDVLAEQAGVSKGLLYHSVGGRQEYLHAILRRMADDLFEATSPVDHPDMVHRLRTSLTDYVRWVQQHRTAYRSFVQAARGGDSPEVREIFEEGRRALTDRIFASSTADDLAVFGIVDSPASRLFARGWSSMVEDVLMEWIDAPAGMSEEQLVETFTVSLGGVLACVPPPS
jgi:AcrR family transcriptional regulator